SCESGNGCLEIVFRPKCPEDSVGGYKDENEIVYIKNEWEKQRRVKSNARRFGEKFCDWLAVLSRNLREFHSGFSVRWGLS
ncbi:hypothetical protein PV325_011941, partial [Microctonus aethiopoides]